MTETGNFRFLKIWTAFGALGLLLILAASLAPQGGELPSIPNLDKFLHFSVYAIASFYFHQLGSKRSSRKIVFLLFAYSALIEILQSQTGTRSAEFLDLAANLVGILTGAFSGLKIAPNFLARIDHGLSFLVKKFRP